MAHDPEAIRKFSAEIGVFERAQSMRETSDWQVEPE